LIGKRNRVKLFYDKRFHLDVLMPINETYRTWIRRIWELRPYTPIEELHWQEEKLFTGWLKDVPFPSCSCAKSLPTKMAAREISIWLVMI
jgi:hypothetical protein